MFIMSVFEDPIPPKPDQFVELKSPYVSFKSMPGSAATTATAHVPHPPRTTRSPSSRFGAAGRSRSRPQTSVIDEGIQELDEKALVDQMMPHSESPTDLNKIKIDIAHVEVTILTALK